MIFHDIPCLRFWNGKSAHRMFWSCSRHFEKTLTINWRFFTQPHMKQFWDAFPKLAELVVKKHVASQLSIHVLGSQPQMDSTFPLWQLQFFQADWPGQFNIDWPDWWFWWHVLFVHPLTGMIHKLSKTDNKMVQLATQTTNQTRM